MHKEANLTLTLRSTKDHHVNILGRPHMLHTKSQGHPPSGSGDF